MVTRGISPKVWAPTAALLVTFVVNLIASGEFDRTELAQLIGAAMTAVVGYLAAPGDIGFDAIPGGGEAGQTHDPLYLLVLVVVVILIVWLVLHVVD